MSCSYVGNLGKHLKFSVCLVTGHSHFQTNKWGRSHFPNSEDSLNKMHINCMRVDEVFIVRKPVKSSSFGGFKEYYIFKYYNILMWYL